MSPINFRDNRTIKVTFSIAILVVIAFILKGSDLNKQLTIMEVINYPISISVIDLFLTIIVACIFVLIVCSIYFKFKKKKQ